MPNSNGFVQFPDMSDEIMKKIVEAVNEGIKKAESKIKGSTITVNGAEIRLDSATRNIIAQFDKQAEAIEEQKKIIHKKIDELYKYSPSGKTGFAIAKTGNSHKLTAEQTASIEAMVDASKKAGNKITADQRAQIELQYRLINAKEETIKEIKEFQAMEKTAYNSENVTQYYKNVMKLQQIMKNIADLSKQTSLNQGFDTKKLDVKSLVKGVSNRQNIDALYRQAYNNEQTLIEQNKQRTIQTAKQGLVTEVMTENPLSKIQKDIIDAEKSINESASKIETRIEQLVKEINESYKTIEDPNVTQSAYDAAEKQLEKSMSTLAKYQNLDYVKNNKNARAILENEDISIFAYTDRLHKYKDDIIENNTAIIASNKEVKKSGMEYMTSLDWANNDLGMAYGNEILQSLKETISKLKAENEELKQSFEKVSESASSEANKLKQDFEESQAAVKVLENNVKNLEARLEELTKKNVELSKTQVGAGTGVGSGVGTGTGAETSGSSTGTSVVDITEVSRQVGQIQQSTNEIVNNLSKSLLEAVTKFKTELQSTSNLSYTKMFESLRNVLRDIVNEFQTSLNNVRFNQSNNLYDTMRGWSDASRYMAEYRSDSDAERAAFANLQTGAISNAFTFDKQKAYNNNLLEILKRVSSGINGEISQVFDTWIHSHPIQPTIKAEVEKNKYQNIPTVGSDVGFSVEDLNTWVKKAFESGLSKMLVTSNYKYTSLDLTDVSKDKFEEFKKEFVKNLQESGVKVGSDGIDGKTTIPLKLKGAGDKQYFDLDDKTNIINSAMTKASESVFGENRLQTGNITDLIKDVSKLSTEEQEAYFNAQKLYSVLNMLGDVLNGVENTNNNPVPSNDVSKLKLEENIDDDKQIGIKIKPDAQSLNEFLDTIQKYMDSHLIQVKFDATDSNITDKKLKDDFIVEQVKTILNNRREFAERDYFNTNEKLSYDEKPASDIFVDLYAALKEGKELSSTMYDALKALNMIESRTDDDGKVYKNLKFNAIQGGLTNKGGFVSEDYSVIARPSYDLDKIKTLQPLLEKVKQEGANVATIIGVIEDKTNDIIYDIQNTVKGQGIWLGTGNKFIDFLDASDEHVNKLISDIKILRDNGLYIDFSGDNIHYDDKNGFSFIDLTTKEQQGQADFEQTLSTFRDAVYQKYNGKGIDAKLVSFLENLNVSKSSQFSNNNGADETNSNILNESAALKNLTSEISTVENAIDNKTRAFQEEEQVVVGTVQREISQLELLDGQLLEIISTIEKLKTTPINLDIKLSGDENADDNLSKILSDLNAQINQIDVEALSKLADSLKELKVNKSVTTNLKDVASALTEFRTSISGISTDENNFLASISVIVSKTDELKDLVKILESSTKKIKEAGKAADDVSKKDDTKDSGQATKKGKTNTNPVDAAISKTTQKMKELQHIGTGELFENVFDKASQKVEKLNADLKSTDISLEEYNKTITQIQKNLNNNTIDFIEPENLVSAQNVMQEYADVISNGQAKWKSSSKDEKELTYTWTDQNKIVHNLKLSYDNLTGALSQTHNQQKRMERQTRSLTERFKQGWQNVSQYAMSFLGFYEIINVLRNAITVVQELDTALTEMRKVSDETVESLKNFQKVSFDLANTVGVTAVEIQNSTADFMKLGYSLQEAAELAEDANIYANVGDMEIDESTEHMISSIEAWKSEFGSAAEASGAIVDRYNEIGNNFAITSADIGVAMERSAAALKAGGNSLNESIGLIVAGNLIQQDAETTAAALKILSLRLRGAKTELEEIGEDTTGLASSTSKLREEILALSGVDIMKDDNTFKSTEDIITELGKVYNSLEDVSQAALLEKIAGELFCQEYVETRIHRTYLNALIA